MPYFTIGGSREHLYNRNVAGIASRQKLDEVINNRSAVQKITDGIGLTNYKKSISTLYNQIWTDVYEKSNSNFHNSLQTLLNSVDDKQQLKDRLRVQVGVANFGSELSITLSNNAIAVINIADKFTAQEEVLVVDQNVEHQYKLSLVVNENHTKNNALKNRLPYDGWAANMHYKNGTFTGTIKNDVPYEGYIDGMSYKNGTFSGKIKNGIPDKGFIDRMSDEPIAFTGLIKRGTPYAGSISKMSYENGIFSGEIKKGLPYEGDIDGMSYENGVFSGEIKDGIPSKGTINGMSYKNGTFSGEIKNGIPDKGFIDGMSDETIAFTGAIKSGTPYTGFIYKMSYENGIFSGEIKNGLPYDGDIDGMSYKNGVFSGEIKDGIPSKGTINGMSYKNGSFSGKIKDGVPYKGEVKATSYRNGVFSGEIKNYIPYNGSVKAIAYKDGLFSGEMRNGALSTGMPKQQSKESVTQFQHLLRTPTKTSDDYKRLLLGDFAGKTLSGQEKFDVTNDNIRRYFESSLAKNTLFEVTESPYKQQMLNQMVQDLMLIAFDVVDPKFRMSWEHACMGRYTGPDQLLSQFSFNTSVIKSVLPGDKVQKEILVKLYKLHYLTFYVERSEFYQKAFPKGIFNIYLDNPFYRKRGVLNEGNSGQNYSHNLGILRGVDKAPNDMRFEFPLIFDNINILPPRCPDRFEMEDPEYASNKDADSWMTEIFQKPYHPVVNGMSGSILVALRFITFCKAYIKNNNQPDFLNDFNKIRDYFRVLSGLFVYFEGGHSYNEIMHIFSLEDVKKETHIVFDKLIDNLSFESIMVDDNSIALIIATMETQQFDTAMQNRDKMHQELSGKLSVSTT